MKPIGVIVSLFAPLVLCQESSYLLKDKAKQRQEELRRGLEGDSRIINGVDASPTRYPYTVSLQGGSFHFCGGSLIAPDVVLSAAHCAFPNVDVVLNPFTLDDPISASETFKADEVVIHPSYKSINIYNHDFQLLKLSGSSSLPPVKLNNDPSLPPPGSSLQVMGWGKTSTASLASQSNILQEVDVAAIANTECASSTAYDSALITDDMLCAAEINRGSCQGDSGGPLVILGDTPDEDIQVGIVSWGSGCAQAGRPGVFARVEDQYNWIRFHVCRLSDDPPEDFDCDNGPVTISPMPTSTPSIAPTASPNPTATPNPTGQSTPVLVRIDMDGHAQETGWSVKNPSGTQVAGVPVGGYEISQCFSTVFEELALESSVEYTFTLLDSFGDGLLTKAYIYLGSEVDETQIIGHFDSYYTPFDYSHTLSFVVSPDGILGNLFPTPAPSMAPSGEPSAPTVSVAPSGGVVTVLLVLSLDGCASETGWRIETSGGNITYQVDTGTYSGLGSTDITEEIELPSDDGSYVFVVVDSHGDGMSQPAVLYLGNVADPGKILAYYDGLAGGFYSWNVPFELDQTIAVFPTSAPTAPTNLPSSSPSAPTISPGPTSDFVLCLFQIDIGYYPTETGWIVMETDTGVVVHEVEPGEYEQSLTTYTTVLDLLEGGAYELTLLDSYGDGFYGNFTIYYGDEDDTDKVLLRRDLETGEYFSREITLGFIVSEMQTINVFPSAAPSTAAPTPPPGPHPPCNVCGDAGLSVTDPDEIFDYTTDVSLRCGTLEEQGAQGLISSSYCASLSGLLNATCACM